VGNRASYTAILTIPSWTSRQPSTLPVNAVSSGKEAGRMKFSSASAFSAIRHQEMP